MICQPSHLDLASVLIGLSLVTLTPAAAQTDQLLIENWNADTCEFTDTVSLVLEQPTMLSRVDTWYRWNPQESAVAYSLLGNGNVIAQGAFAR